MKHFGHIIRHNSLEKTIIQGITAGKRGRGRPARTWEKDIEEWAGTNIGEATRMAETERRDLWCYSRGAVRRALGCSTGGGPPGGVRFPAR